jgi:thymidine phosphorylase
VAVASLIAQRHPGWALWGGMLVILGLFARTFHAGINHLAFQLVDSRGAEEATRIIAETYGAPHIFHTLSAAIMFGWIVLAIGAYRSGTLGLVRAVALGLMALLPSGTLKGTTTLSIVAVAGLCIALVPLGVTV